MKGKISKKEKDKQLVVEMISLYCKKKHGKKTELCKSCFELTYYAKLRSDKCPYMETKTFCTNCKVHCYKTDMREKIRVVMKYSGPRMLFTHPLTVLNHVIKTKQKKKYGETK